MSGNKKSLFIKENHKSQNHYATYFSSERDLRVSLILDVKSIDLATETDDSEHL